MRTQAQPFALVVAALALACAGCAFHGEGLEGRVFEVQNPEAPPPEWKRVPVADAEVLVVWNAYVVDNPVHGNSSCLRAVYTRTDSKGLFSVDGWWRSPQWKWITMSSPVSYSFKAGLEGIPHDPGIDRVWSDDRGVHSLRRSTRTDGGPTREELFVAAKRCPPAAATR